MRWRRYIALRLWPESVAAFHQVPLPRQFPFSPAFPYFYLFIYLLQALLLAPKGSRSVPLQNVIQVQRKTCEWQANHPSNHLSFTVQPKTASISSWHSLRHAIRRLYPYP
jgi:hypothetical protein